MNNACRPAFVVLCLAILAGASPARADSFSVAGFFSAGGETFVCLQPPGSTRSAWVTEDDVFAGWWVRTIFTHPLRKVVLEAADGQVVEIPIEFDSAGSPLPPDFKPAWINSEANPMFRVSHPEPDVWAWNWATIAPEEQAAVLTWYRNHGLGIDITVKADGASYQIIKRWLARPNREELRAQTGAFEQSLSSEQRSKYVELMAAETRAIGGLVDISRPETRPVEPLPKPPDPKDWDAFIATLSDDQRARFRRLFNHGTHPSRLEQLEIAGFGSTPTAEVYRALQSLRQQESYTWQTIGRSTFDRPHNADQPPPTDITNIPRLTDRWIAQAASDPRQRRTLGWFDRDGLTKVTMMEGGTAAWVDGVMDRGQRRIVLTPRGWLTPDECSHAARTEGVDRITFGGTALPRNLCYTVATAAAHPMLPEDDLAELITHTRLFRIVGDLHVADLKKRYFGWPAQGRDDAESSHSSSPGVLALRIDDGDILEYHLIVRVPTVDHNGNELERVREHRTRISKHGSTTVDIPEAARDKFAALAAGGI